MNLAHGGGGIGTKPRGRSSRFLKQMLPYVLLLSAQASGSNEFELKRPFAYGKALNLLSRSTVFENPFLLSVKVVGRTKRVSFLRKDNGQKAEVQLFADRPPRLLYNSFDRRSSSTMKAEAVGAVLEYYRRFGTEREFTGWQVQVVDARKLWFEVWTNMSVPDNGSHYVYIKEDTVAVKSGSPW